jgi:hypothetical protein
VPRGLGPRFLIEAGFIIAVATVAGVERFRTVVIIVVVASAWAVVAAVELALELRRRTRRTAAGPAEPELAPPPVEATVVVSGPEVRTVASEPEPTPEPVAAPGPERLEAPAEEPAEPEAPAPAPAEPAVVAVAPAEPEPEAQPEPSVEPEPAVVSLASRRGGPREWNLWELERIAREQVSDDVALNEERAYLLVYLRDFANADGVLSADFDAVVRETFGSALDAVYAP